MPLNLSLPDWVPWWVQLVVLIAAILFGFALLMMPFSVFGVKARLDFLEAHLDDIHAELRMIATRLPEPGRRPEREPVFEELARPSPSRHPSPMQMPEQPPMPMRERMPAPAVSPPPVVPSVFRSAPRAPAPPRFAAGIEPRAEQSSSPPRFAAGEKQRPSYREAEAAGDWDDAPPPPPVTRRPLRATTLRDAERDPGGDRFRSEPTLRWPPR